MPKWSMPDIVAKGYGFNEIFVQPEKPANSPGDLGYKLNMEDTVRDMVIANEVKYLGFINVARVGEGVKNSVSVE